MICKIVNYFPIIKFNKKMPNGVKRKIMSSYKIKKILKSYKQYNKKIFYNKLEKLLIIIINNIMKIKKEIDL